MQQTITSVYNPSKEKQKIAVSSLKIFDGEDLTAGDRRRMQALQQKEWIEQQIREKEERKRAEKAADLAFANQTLELNSMRTALETEHKEKRTIMEKAYKQDNIQRAKDKFDKERQEKNEEQEQKISHITYNTNNDFYTENPETCQSSVSQHRVLKYHWKGMNEIQKAEFRADQDRQRKEAELQKKLQKDEEKLYALQAEHQRQMQIQMEREKQRRKTEILKNHNNFNQLQKEEQKIKIKTMYDAPVITYKP